MQKAKWHRKESAYLRDYLAFRIKVLIIPHEINVGPFAPS